MCIILITASGRFPAVEGVAIEYSKRIFPNTHDYIL